MKPRFRWLIVLILLLTLSSCVVTDSSPTVEPEPATPTVVGEEPPRVLISEVLAGVEGNNNYEFIELYNTSATEPVDLDGWTLWYQLEEGHDQRILQRWTEHTVIPPHGHYLLGRAGESFEVTVDQRFDTPLATSRGGLLLRKADDEAGDSLSWGNDPQRYGEGEPAPAMDRGISLERRPGGDQGNAVDTGNNRQDFVLNEGPQPQGVSSRRTPLIEESLEISLSAPQSVEPGVEYQYDLQVVNQTEESLTGVRAVLDLPDDLTVLATSENLSGEGHSFLLLVDELDSGAAVSGQIKVRAPWTYLDLEVANYYVAAENWAAPAYGGPVRTAIAGGSIPISTARSLVGKEVAVEGTATMYTGGFFAGSLNTKFYLEDDTGGIQVWVPDGENKVHVDLGDLVRVRGKIELYRGAVELIVNDLARVEILQDSAAELPLQPTDVGVQRAVQDESLAGKLVQVEGEVVRAEEFSYSYEIDLADEAGERLTLYVDKNTDMTIEGLEVGDRYQATGILEVRDSRLQLYPRVQRDLAKVYPPILRLTLDVPKSVPSGETFTGTLSVFNHTSQTMTGIEVSLTLPPGAMVEEVLDGGELRADNELHWRIPELAGGGSSEEVRFLLQAAGQEELLLEQARATADQWEKPAEIAPRYVFLGSEIPIWAIQGSGFRSEYVLEEVTTSGVVTGVFPELGGFFIQELETDDDPRTSSGLFINTDGKEVDVVSGDMVRVRGTVREEYQQTQVSIESREDIERLSTRALPRPVALEPPLNSPEAESYFESLEGMRVQVAEPALVVAPTTKYGEYTVVLPEQRVSRLWTAQARGVGITVDDGSSDVVHQDRSTLDYVVAVGDKVTNLVGPLAYTFGQYKIEPTQPPQVIDLEQQLPSLPMTAEDEFSIATWNVENLFDFKLPNPSDPEMPTVQEYEVEIAKVANTIRAAGLPTVVGLQEVEHIGILEDIAAHPRMADYDYQPALIEGTDSRGIDVGYLVRGDRAQLESVEQYPAPEGLTSRPPLLVRITVGEEELEIYVINNHFTSMSAGELATEPRRKAQAAWNVTIMEEILKDHPQAHVAVIGDLNSYYASPPLDILRRAGLQHVMSTLPDKQRYNYIYQGRSQLLDHILVTPSLMDLLARVDVLHTNADFPLPLPGDTSPLRTSDHDLVISTFHFPE